MKSFFQAFSDRRNLLMLGMGIASGLPLPLIGGALKMWLQESNIDLTTIGLLTSAGLPYTLKFLWSPVFDRFSPPLLGRRRGWLLLSQIGLVGATIGLSFTHPGESIQLVAIWALLIAFLGASQDIVIDAYRWEILKPEEYGIGTSTYVMGYRISLLVGGTLSLLLVDKDGFVGLSWPAVYQLMSLGFLIGIGCTLAATEPKVYSPPPKNLKESVIDPFSDYLTRPGALAMLAFILLYKVGDNIAGEMLWPFYKDLGYTLTIIGAASKFTGFVGTILGGFIGGALILRLGLVASLWICGIFQSISTLSFTWLAWFGAAALATTAATPEALQIAKAVNTPPTWALVVVIFIENLTSGMGTSAFMAFMGILTNKKYTATQYALFTSFMGVPRVIMGSGSGWLAAQLGWQSFFVVCATIALPGMLLLIPMSKWVHDPVVEDIERDQPTLKPNVASTT